ncbi:MAG: ABC transporter substrate-binding protein [Acidimicrobiales bacterium]
MPRDGIGDREGGFMNKVWSKGGKLVAALAIAGLLAAGCANNSSSSSISSASGPASSTSGSSAPGVTPTAIVTGAISTLTGPLAGNFKDLVPGVQAYFDMVNAQGGINGRKLLLSHSLDDGGNPSQFNTLAHTLISQDHVFAVSAISSPFFQPGYFASTGVPTYGYNVTGNWAGPPNLFAAGGSVQYYPGVVPQVAYVIDQIHAKSIAIISYNVPASSDACQATENGLKSAGYNVSYVDLSVNYGSSLASDVQRMQQAGSDFVLSCMDVTGNINMARYIQQYGLKIHQLWLNGNDQNVLNAYPSLMKGVYFITAHVPFTAPTQYYPGLAQYLSAMNKYEPHYTYDETAIQGWESAALFAAGVKAAGSNLTQQRVVALTNKMTAFTAGGLTTPTNWTTAHTTKSGLSCAAFIQVQGKRFVSVFAPGHKVFLCFNLNPNHPKPVTPPAGTPGG